MKTAVDTSVLLDVLAADAVHGDRSREALRGAYRSGALVACDVVWAEVRAHFTHERDFRDTMTTLGLRFDTLSDGAAVLAGQMWRQHRSRSSGARVRVMADFLVGAHSKLQADALLTRDRGFYRGYFVGLKIIDPTQR